MSYLRNFENLIEVIQLTGELYGKPAKVFEIMGRRAGFTSTTEVNDVVEFGPLVAVDPELDNASLDIISSSADDDSGSGIGIRQVRVTYLDTSNNIVESEGIKTTGTSLHENVLSGVNFVLWMEALEVGSHLSAVGDIRLRVNGTTDEVEQISTGYNKSLSSHFKVPAGYTGYLHNWKAHAIGATQQAKLTATVNTLSRDISIPFHAQQNCSVAANTNSGLIFLPFLKLPALSRIKINTISAATAMTNQCDASFVIVLIAD